MAPFNKRQIGYIQAIAGRQQHRTLKCGNFKETISSATGPTDAAHRPALLDNDRVKGIGYAGNAARSDCKSLLLFSWLLDHVEKCHDSSTAHNDGKLTTDDITYLSDTSKGFGNYHKFECFDAPVTGTYEFSAIVPGHADAEVNVAPEAEGQVVRNHEYVKSIERATPDGFLNSTDVKFRFTLPGKYTANTVSGHGAGTEVTHPMGQDHYEFRWIVWRSKRPTLHHDISSNENHTNLEALRDGVSFRNPGYDLFMGQTGRKRGLIGHTLNKDLDKDMMHTTPDAEAYSGYRWDGSGWVQSGVGHTKSLPDGESTWTVDDLMTARINRDDYVVMKDVRFFLGKEHGKSHFEDTLHWDWNDPIDTTSDNVLTSTTLNSKNYRWHMTLMGTTGGQSPCEVNVNAAWTTKMESG